jgi:hypothetical protein
LKLRFCHQVAKIITSFHEIVDERQINGHISLFETYKNKTFDMFPKNKSYEQGPWSTQYVENHPRASGVSLVPETIPEHSSPEVVFSG